MIAKAIKEEHPRRRPLHLTVEHFFKGYPGFSMLAAEDRRRARPTRPTSTACSTTSSSSCSCSPRAARAPRSSTRTATGCAASAAAASSRPRCAPARRSCRSPSSAPRRPRRSSPTSRALQRLTGLLYFPITPTFPHFGLARDARLPAGEVPDPLPAAGPAPTTWATSRGRTRRSSRPSPHDIRAHDPGGAARHGRQAQVASGSAWSADARASRRILITGLSTYWGGRLAQALERDPAVETVIGVDRTAAEGRARAHRVRPGRRLAPLIRRIVEAAEIDTVVDTRLVVDSIVTTAAPRPREQRHRHDEHPRRLRRPRLAGPQGRLQVQRALLRLRAGRPGVLHRGDARPHPPRTPIERDIVEAETAVARLPPSATRTSRSRVLRFANGLGPDLRTSRSAPARPARPSRRSSASTRAASSSTRTTSSAASSTRCATTSTASTTAPPTACSRCREVAGLLGKPLAPVLPPWGTGLAAAALRRARGPRSRPRCCGQLRFGRGAGQPPAQGDRLPLPLHDARDGPEARASTSASRRSCAARRPRATATSARSRSSCATARASAPQRPAPRPPARAPQRAQRRAPGATGAARRRPARPRRPRRPREIIALLPSLEPGRTSAALREHEAAHSPRAPRGASRAIERAAARAKPLAPYAALQQLDRAVSHVLHLSLDATSSVPLARCVRALHRSSSRPRAVLVAAGRRRLRLRPGPRRTRSPRASTRRRRRRRRPDRRRRRARSSSRLLVQPLERPIVVHHGRHDVVASAPARRGSRPTSTRWSTRRWRAAARATSSRARARNLTGGDGRRRRSSRRSPTPSAAIVRLLDQIRSGVDRKPRRRHASSSRPRGSATIDGQHRPRGRRASDAAPPDPRRDRRRRRADRAFVAADQQGPARRSPPTELAEKYDTRSSSTAARFQLTLYKTSSSSRPTRSPSARSASRRRPGSTTSRTRRSNPAWTRARTRLGRRASPARSSPAARPRTRSRRAGWASSTAPASTAPTDDRLDRHRRLARLHPHARSRTSIELYDQVPVGAPDLHRLAEPRAELAGGRLRRRAMLAPTGTSSQPRSQQGGMVVAVAKDQRADEHALLLLAQHRVPHGRRVAGALDAHARAAAAARPPIAIPASMSWRWVAT